MLEDKCNTQAWVLQVITDYQKTLKRKEQFDERSRKYPIREILDANGRPKAISNVWECPAWLNQLQEGSCVGHAFAHDLAATPISLPDMTHEKAVDIFNKAKTIDEWVGEEYQYTSVLAGIKATMLLYPTVLQSYRWAFGLDDVLHTLSYIGPLVLGIPWYTGMFCPSVTGLILPTGSVAGGHAILARGVDVDNRTVLLRNSWGKTWGYAGDCVIRYDDLNRLLHERGDACIPLKI